jgi:Pregnancy-associated plasma protein-A
MKRVVLLAVATLALVASSMATAGGHDVAAAGANADCAAAWSPLAQLTAGSTARGPFKEPVLRAGPSDSNIPGKDPSPNPSFSTRVTTWVHVVTKGDGATLADDEGYVNGATIAQQMNVLNLAFGGSFGTTAARTGFQFDLAGTTYTRNASWFDAEPGAPDEFGMKAALKRGGGTTLNLYLTNAADQQLLGWAYYPKINVWKKAVVLDGVVVNYLSLPGGPFGSAFSLGQTATHEVGHWLGLPHTFEQGCQGHGDYVDDTPAMLVPTSGCPEGKDTCPRDPGLDPIHNFMDYSFDSCYEEFTNGQTGRMQRQWLHWRVHHG